MGVYLICEEGGRGGEGDVAREGEGAGGGACCEGCGGGGGFVFGSVVRFMSALCMRISA